jgi:hypothetical protein
MAEHDHDESPIQLTSYIKKKAVIDAFWFLHYQGRNAAIDIDHVTGTLVLMASKSSDGVPGLDPVPQPYNHNYIRMLVTGNSEISK